MGQVKKKLPYFPKPVAMDITSSLKNIALRFRKLIKLFTRLDREVIASIYLKGNGIELGALHNPLKVPPAARVRYVDRMTVADLRRHYPELASQNLVPVDIIDDGQKLSTLEDNTQDFVIANHFLEHCENPIEALRNILRVLKVNGVIFLALPDKRFTFDVEREETSFEHLVRDFREGPAWSRRMHFEDWVRHVEHLGSERIAERTDELMTIDYSIHFHVWSQDAMFLFLVKLKDELDFPFDVEVFLKKEGEGIFVLRKLN